MEYLVAVVIWAVVAWYQIVQPSLTYSRGKPDLDPELHNPGKDDTDELIARLDKELEGD